MVHTTDKSPSELIVTFTNPTTAQPFPTEAPSVVSVAQAMELLQKLSMEFPTYTRGLYERLGCVLRPSASNQVLEREVPANSDMAAALISIGRALQMEMDKLKDILARLDI